MVLLNKRVIVPGDQNRFPHRGQRVTVHYTAAVSHELKTAVEKKKLKQCIGLWR